MNKDKLEKEILDEYKEKSYTMKEPFIKLDPYNASPLSALVMFKTEDPSTIQLTVGSEEDDEAVMKEFNAEKEIHELPVVGLYPDMDNEVKIGVTNTRGETKEITLTISTDPLPEDFMVNKLIRSHPASMSKGLTFMVPTEGHLYAIDSNADIRWYSSLETRIIFNILENGNYLQTSYEDSDDAYSTLMEPDFLCKVSE